MAGFFVWGDMKEKWKVFDGYVRAMNRQHGLDDLDGLRRRLWPHFLVNRTLQIMCEAVRRG